MAEHREHCPQSVDDNLKCRCESRFYQRRKVRRRTGRIVNVKYSLPTWDRRALNGSDRRRGERRTGGS